MEKRTPAPWVVRPAVCRYDHPDTSADVQGPQGQFVADCGCHDQATANAHLIAAAPTLLALLIQLRDEWFEPHYATNDIGMAALLRDKIRDAIAKAEGR